MTEHTFHRIVTLACVAVFSFLGGAFMQSGIGQAFAQSIGIDIKTIKRASENTGIVQFVDSNQINRADFGVYRDAVMQNLYSEQGGLRLQQGVYTQSGEKGLPFIGLSDNKNQLRFLFRLAGSNESPVMIFKDKSGKDRMVMGLGLNDGSQEPFLAYFDASGKRNMAFGIY